MLPEEESRNQADIIICQSEMHSISDNTAKWYCKICKMYTCSDCLLDPEKHSEEHIFQKLKIDDHLSQVKSYVNNTITKVDSKLKNSAFCKFIDNSVRNTKKQMSEHFSLSEKGLDNLIAKLQNLHEIYKEIKEKINKRIENDIVEIVPNKDYKAIREEIKQLQEFVLKWTDYGRRNKVAVNQRAEKFEAEAQAKIESLDKSLIDDVNSLIKVKIESFSSQLLKKMDRSSDLTSLDGKITDLKVQLNKMKLCLDKDDLNSLEDIAEDKDIIMEGNEVNINSRVKKSKKVIGIEINQTMNPSQEATQVADREVCIANPMLNNSLLNFRPASNTSHNSSVNNSLSSNTEDYKMLLGISLCILKDKSINPTLTIYNPNYAVNTFTKLKYDPNWCKFESKFTHFPYDNSKFVNTGSALVITGGIDGQNGVTNACFGLNVEYQDKKYIVSIKLLPSMQVKREKHNVIFLKDRNTVLVCGGYNTTTTEVLELSGTAWKNFKSMNTSRTNATLVYVNSRFVYCFSGYLVREKDRMRGGNYLSSCECLDLDNANTEWSVYEDLDKVYHVNIKLCAMGVVQKDDKYLLVGGYDGSTYLSNVVELTFDSNGKIGSLKNSSNQLTKGAIFPSAQFLKFGEKFLNFEWMLKMVVYNKNTTAFDFISI